MFSERIHFKTRFIGIEIFHFPFLPQGLLGHIRSSIFTPDITPLILAAHRDNYAIIKTLIDYGNKIAKPHELRCVCRACDQASYEDSLQHSKLRINAYRALSSPCFIALSSSDPILTAFELSWETKRLGRLENEFKVSRFQLRLIYHFRMIMRSYRTIARPLLQPSWLKLEDQLNWHSFSTATQTTARTRTQFFMECAVTPRDKPCSFHVSDLL